jgi:hypothetical protein
MQVTFQLENDINDVLQEFGIPEFNLLPEIEDTDDMITRVVNGYHKEVRIQSIWGGIRNPAAVLQNKIRHELTNYDEVRDALTDALDQGLDETMVIDIREELVNMSYQMCAAIIEMLPESITVTDNQRGLLRLTRKQLHKANDGYWYRESKQVHCEKQRVYAAVA